MLLRDIDLRWSNDDPAPEGFLKRGPVEYLFHRELRALKIETPGFAKINVYCAPKQKPYAGRIHDGVTAVDVACRWQSIEHLTPPKLARAFCDLLADGARTVLAHFSLASAATVAALAERVVAATLDPVPFGKPATGSKERGVAARLSIRSATSLEYATVSAQINKGRTQLADVPVCTTHPVLDYAIENLDTFEWVGKSRLRVVFATYGSENVSAFGRRNFDATDFEHVAVTQSADRQRRVFTVDVPSA